MCLDLNGNLYIAFWGGSAVIKYDNEGNHICSYDLPEKFITNVVCWQKFG